MNITRRHLLKTGLVAGAAAGLGDLSFLAQLSPVSAAEAELDPRSVRLDPSIEPLVRLIEETPRDRLLEEVAARLKRGLSYRELLAGLLLAGVKNVEPRPSVGFKFHAVLVVNSAHLASLASPPEHRWLPIFWALDHYKSAAARDVQERGDWVMAPVKESSVPDADRAAAVYADAMRRWDEAEADAAVAGMARTAGANETYELLFRLGARDFRSIGHKAIYVANSWRTLQCIGWRHAEPVLRSLTYALLAHEGENPLEGDAEPDRPYRRNVELVKRIKPGWNRGGADEGATRELLETLRGGSAAEASEAVVELLNRGAGPQSILDALHVCAGEFLMQQPGIVALHAVTTTNALSFAFHASGNDETRRLLLMQNAAFLPLFRAAMSGRGSVQSVRIDDLKPAEAPETSDQAVDQIFSELSRQPKAAAEQALAFLEKTHRAEDLIRAARVLVFLKGNDSHDYKFSSAVLEDYYNVSPRWRDLYFASNMFKLRGAGGRDNALVERTRAAFNA